MITTARIRPDQWELLKQVRLEALQEAPYAFSATYAGTVTRSDAEWQAFARQRAEASDTCMFFAFDGALPVGMAGAFFDADEAPIQLVSVWVAPSHRGTGAGAAVVEAVCAWAAALPVEAIAAWVTDGNVRALRFYERLGFRNTGRRKPYPPEPERLEIETVRVLQKQ